MTRPAWTLTLLIVLAFSTIADESALESGRKLLADGKTDAAIARFSEAVELDPKNAELRLWLGRALLTKLQKASGLDQALYASRVKEAFEKAVELDPRSVEARTSLAGYYTNAPFIAGGSFKKAKKQAEAVMELDPLRGQLLMANIHVEAKEWSEAEAALERALGVDPSNAGTHLSLGRVYQETGRWPAASSAFEEAVALDPQLAQAWYQIGRTGALSGQNLDRALEALDVYLHRHAGGGGPVFHAGAWWRRGAILEKMGRKEEAIAAYEKSLEIRADERVTEALNALTRPR